MNENLYHITFQLKNRVVVNVVPIATIDFMIEFRRNNEIIKWEQHLLEDITRENITSLKEGSYVVCLQDLPSPFNDGLAFKQGGEYEIKLINLRYEGIPMPNLVLKNELNYMTGDFLKGGNCTLTFEGVDWIQYFKYY